MSDLSDLFTEAREANPDADTATIADTVLDMALASDNPHALLFPAVHQFAITADRSRVRATEKKSAPFDQPEPKPASKPKYTAKTDADGNIVAGKPGSADDPALAARRALMSEKCQVPGKGYIPWGDLTVEDHEAIIEHYTRRIAGHEATITRHREAIEVIESRGAKNLNEVYRAHDLAA